MINTNWFVITGAPSCGKSSIINLLAKKNYATIQEAARLHILQELNKGLTIPEIIKDFYNFQYLICKKSHQLLENIDIKKPYFLDRSSLDNLAYLNTKQINWSELKEKCSKFNYKKVFILDSLPYEQDNVRIESSNQKEAEKEAAQIRLELINVYKYFKIPIIKVPVFPLEERTQFILDNLDS